MSESRYTKEQLYALRKDLLTWKAVADHLDISEKHLIEVKKQVGIITRGRLSPSVIEQLVSEGKSKCAICKEVKPLSAFYKNRCRKNGHDSLCIPCKKVTRPKTGRRDNLKTRYNITPEEWTEMFTKQNQRCAVCKTTESAYRNNKPRFCVDHCHATGKIRGILCSKCNAAIGMIDENPEILKGIAEYLNFDLN